MIGDNLSLPLYSFVIILIQIGTGSVSQLCLFGIAHFEQYIRHNRISNKSIHMLAIVLISISLSFPVFLASVGIYSFLTVSDVYVHREYSKGSDSLWIEHHRTLFYFIMVFSVAIALFQFLIFAIFFCKFVYNCCSRETIVEQITN